jgi:small subunit ribosomal protein S17
MSKRTITGVVTSLAGDKTIIVTRTTRQTHRLYGKKFTTSRKFHVHDQKNQAALGDTVLIVEHKPFSAHKTWALSQILERGRERFEIKKTVVEEELEAKRAKANTETTEETDAKEVKT